jgi:DNA polymerase I-like protein with 3'-5' exonuclease and polymerase domains
MIKPLVFDIETSISDGIHGADATDKQNDFYTVIFGKRPDQVQVYHKTDGFGRELPFKRSFSIGNTNLIVGHNLGFDLAYIWNCPEFQDYLKAGGKIWDTQVAEYILTGQQHRNSSLAELQGKYLNQKYKIDRISKLYQRGIGADKIVTCEKSHPRLFETYHRYCQLDGTTTLNVMKKQYIRAKKGDMLRIIELYNDYLLALINMRATGILFDKSKALDLKREYHLKYVEYLEKAQQVLESRWSNPRLPDFNVNSFKHKSAVMFGGVIKNKVKTKVGKYKNGNDKYKLVEHEIYIPGFELPTALTTPAKEDGYYATGDDVITKLKNHSKNKDFLRYIDYADKASEYKKAANTDLEGFLKYSVEDRIYPNFNNTQVVTGRLSSSRPNLQNITKHSKIGKEIHSLLKAPKGWRCVSADFSQLEIWVSAFLSNDKQLIDDLKSGIDMHCMRVSHMEDCSYEYALEQCKVQQDPEWAAKRSAAKTFSYQRAYGAGIGKLEEFTGLDRDTLKRLVEAEETRYPDASSLWEKIRDSVDKTKRPSRSYNIPSKMHGAGVTDKVELLPIFDKFNNKTYTYNNTSYVREVGYWRSPTGKAYHFPDMGRVLRGGLVRSVSPTILKNYPMQGTAADIQAATSAELFKSLIKYNDLYVMVNEVHDSKWFYVREDMVHRIVPYIINIMEDVPKIFKERFGLDVPFKFPVDVSIGDTFNEVEMENYVK